MKTLFLLLLGIFVCFSCSNDVSKSEISHQFVAEVLAENYESAYALFDAKAKSQISLNQFESIWIGLKQQYGNIRDCAFNCLEEKANYKVAYFTCIFDNKLKLDLKLVTEFKSSEIQGFFIVPVHNCTLPGNETSQTEQANADFNEKEVSFLSDRLQIPGTLTIPNKEINAICLLIHGSGPSDRDETVGPNKPFKDLARGLALNHVATLRYDKRTYITKDAKDVDTPEEEVINDVLAAINWIDQQDGLRDKPLILIGHSFGGMLLPEIARLQQSTSGYVFLAANASPLEDLIVSQLNYIYNLDGTLTDVEKTHLQELQRQSEHLKLNLSELSKTENLPFAVPAKYWLWLKKYRPLEKVVNVDKPMLFLQGGRDYQVKITELDLWKSVLERRGDVSFVTFDKLNHLLMEGKGLRTPEEYQNIGNVPQYVMDEIAQWINQLTLK